MRLVPKKIYFFLFIHHLQSTLRQHTPFPAALLLFVAFLESILWDIVYYLR
jgi:hypothetical protein